MIARWQRISLRARLTATFALVFGAMLVAYSLAVYLLIRDRFAAELDHRLDQEIEIAERSIGRDADGRLVWHHSHEPGYAPIERQRNVSWLDVWQADGARATPAGCGGGIWPDAGPPPTPHGPACACWNCPATCTCGSSSAVSTWPAKP